MRGAGGAVQAVSDTWLSLDVVEGQGLEIQNVSVTENAATGLLPSGITLSFRMQVTGAVDDQKPLFTAGWISDYSTQVTTDALPIAAGPEGGPLRLTAVPSITRAGTELRAGRPFERAASVLIHDVMGRAVGPAGRGARHRLGAVGRLRPRRAADRDRRVLRARDGLERRRRPHRPDSIGRRPR